MGRFTNPRDLYFGEGARHEVKNLKGKKAIIVSGGSSMRRGGFLQDVEADLKEGGFEVKLFEGVESDPSIETVMKGAEAMREFEPDWIIAIGGGSPIDAAKAMWVFYEYPEESFDNIIQPFSFPELRQKAHFCAISSTSGTATEVTAFSVITDYAKGIKYPLADFNITPDVAIVDPELTYTMPAKLCAHTGMDALTHCMEAYVSTCASMFTDANALHGIREIVEWLPKSYAGDHEARQHMHEAQCIAGIAFSSGLLGIVHSMAHKTGAAFENGHIIHGAANAMYLGKVIQWNSKDPRAAERYAYVAKEILHLPGETNEELIAALVQKIRDLNDQLNIPQSIKDYANGGVKVDAENPQMVSEEEFLAKLPEIVSLAKKYGARTMVDDAHALGVIGRGGRGTADHFGLADEVDIYMGTFSKSLASLGGYMASSAPVAEYVRHTSRPFIFSASIPPASCATALAALRHLRAHPEIVDRLAEITRYVHQGMLARGIRIRESNGIIPIIPIYTKDVMTTLSVAKAIYDAGVYVNPVLPPAVPESDCLLRTSYMAIHTEALLDEALDIIRDVLVRFGIQ